MANAITQRQQSHVSTVSKVVTCVCGGGGMSFSLSLSLSLSLFLSLSLSPSAHARVGGVRGAPGMTTGGS